MTQTLTLIDLEFGISQLSGNRALLLTLLNKFSDEYRQTDDKLQQLCASDDFDAARAHIHTLKGVAGNLGLRALHVACKEQEDALKAENTLPENYDTFIAVLNDTLGAISLLDDNPDATAPSGDADTAVAKAALLSALKANEFVPEAQLQEWLTSIFSDEAERNIISEFIDELDYQSAIDRIEG
ncbi:Hpt domain-containing protein [Alteromonas sp. ASW11-19]|uniref:Hpt domain-containing protein n=1 Tax=Alteromonas salexigens TaxID=2982530 RepID=A0ABT2VP68_9ALTE|nr:Hpt domain-containing protein [Alteromonas salexigens]MCU7555110.1 Hpt domain-containing protein [Alteromonas salexigens]